MSVRQTIRGGALSRLLSGVALVAAFWWGSWHSERLGALSAVAFFGLWLGYILIVDAVVEMRTSSSPLTRDRGLWLFLFVASVPAWWLFEVLNHFLRNWEYVGGRHLTGPADFAVSSLSFSTVIPAVFTTAELVASFGVPGRLTGLRQLRIGARALAASIALGAALFGGLLLQPRLFYPAAWLCIILMLDPVNNLLGRPSISRRVGEGDWRLLWVLGLAALVCGFFWELWNYRADPKWIYHIPFFGRGQPWQMPKLFEMPLPGYLGYVPFGLELFALFEFTALLAGRASLRLGFEGPEKDGTP